MILSCSCACSPAGHGGNKGACTFPKCSSVHASPIFNWTRSPIDTALRTHLMSSGQRSSHRTIFISEMYFYNSECGYNYPLQVLSNIGTTWNEGSMFEAEKILWALLMIASSVPSAIAQSAGNTPGSPGPIAVASPQDYQVFQRRTRLSGSIHVQGHTSIPVTRVEMRISGTPLSGRLSSKWQAVSFDTTSGDFAGDVSTRAGGFYRVEIRVSARGGAVCNTTIPHVGVGEVFVIAGQSNATNYGEVLQKTQAHMVTTFDGERWAIADDPQPGVQDNSKKGSFIPSFGDAIFRRYHVPVGIAAVGHGSTSVRQWLPAGAKVEVMPTMTKYIVTSPDGTLISDGTLFNGLMARIHQLGAGGFRALLWHQGESDCHQSADHEISAATYGRMMQQLIHASREAARWDFPWMVAQASYHTPEDIGCASILAAQHSLVEEGIALQGPDTDTLGAPYRQNQGKGTHFSDEGLKAHGLLWAERVSAYLDHALAER